MATEIEISRESKQRALLAHALRFDGWSYINIGQCFGISSSRSRDLANKGERLISRRYSSLNHCAVKVSNVDVKQKLERADVFRKLRNLSLYGKFIGFG